MCQLCRKCLSCKGIRSHDQQSTAQAPTAPRPNAVARIRAADLRPFLALGRTIKPFCLGHLPRPKQQSGTYSVPQLEDQDDRTSEDLPFGSRGGLAVRHYFPLDGEYEFKIDLRRNFYNYIRGLGNVPHRLDVRVDRELVKTFMVGGDFEGARCATSFCGSGGGGFPEWGAYSVTADEVLRVRLPVKEALCLSAGRPCERVSVC